MAPWYPSAGGRVSRRSGRAPRSCGPAARARRRTARRGSSGTRTRRGAPPRRVAVARERRDVVQRAGLGVAAVAAPRCRACGCTSVPVRPATASERVERVGRARCSSMRRQQRDDLARRRAVAAREARSRRRRSGAMPSCATVVAHDRGARASCSRRRRTRAPSALISVSAMKLSDGRFIGRRARAIGGEAHSRERRHRRSGVSAGAGRAGDLHARGARAPSSNAWAAKRGGLAWKYGRRLPVRPWLKASALSGPTSLEVAVARGRRRRGRPSNADSSPITRPVDRASGPAVGQLLGERRRRRVASKRRVAAAAQVRRRRRSTPVVVRAAVGAAPRS